MLIHPSGALRQKKVCETQKAAGEGQSPALAFCLLKAGFLPWQRLLTHKQWKGYFLTPERVAAQSPALLERATLQPQRMAEIGLLSSIPRTPLQG